MPHPQNSTSVTIICAAGEINYRSDTEPDVLELEDEEYEENGDVEDEDDIDDSDDETSKTDTCDIMSAVQSLQHILQE